MGNICLDENGTIARGALIRLIIQIKGQGQGRIYSGQIFSGTRWNECIEQSNEDMAKEGPRSRRSPWIWKLG